MVTRNLRPFVFPLLLLILLLQSLHLFAAQTDVKGTYWFLDSGLAASSIDSTLFTHLFCAFADIDPTTNQVNISPSNTAAFSSFTSTVRQKNPSVVTLLSIGGGNSKQETFAAMVSQASSRKSFIDSSIQVARANGFLGLDLDWEYPRSVADMSNLGTLLGEWRAAINAEASSSGDDPLLLTAAFYVSAFLNELKYPAGAIGESLDWVNVMAYDAYDPSWKKNASAHAALYDPFGGVGGASGIDGWLNAGLAAKNLVLGFPYYGYAWNLVDPSQHGIGAPATGKASGPGIDSQYGTIEYNQIKAFIQSNGATTVYNDTVVVNYCYSGTTWIGYDDVESVAAKVSFAKQKGLRGYYAWSANGDYNWVLSKTALTTWG